MASIAKNIYTLPDVFFNSLLDQSLIEAGAQDVFTKEYAVMVTLPDGTRFDLTRLSGKYGDDVLNAWLRSGSAEKVDDFMYELDSSQLSDWRYSEAA